MATLNVESISTTDIINVANTLTITKPTGLEVGDLMVAYLGLWSGGSASWNTLSGWTEIADVEGTEGAGEDPCIAVQVKIADSGDVAASNFTFTHGLGTLASGGCILRVSNPDAVNIPGDFETSYSAVNTSSISFSVSLDPGTDDCLVIYGIACMKTSSAITLGAITTTPSQTITNAYNDSFSNVDYQAMRVGYNIQTAQTAVTAYASTASDVSVNHVGVVVAIRPNHPSSGTVSLLDTTTDFYAPTASADTNGSATLLETDTTIQEPTGKGNSPTQWTNEADTDTTWTNEASL